MITEPASSDRHHREAADRMARALRDPRLRRAINETARGRPAHLIVAGVHEALGDVLRRVGVDRGLHVLAIEDPSEPLGYRLIRVG
ncbi:hypothetical protein [Longispora fulva]|uniref:Uncharacterized protein n=1 Tax=Longispora fulva TaxID=619741 RepID=A0A8J7GQQ4_9ACTN|nr:hypothetical protein [Longispora fulva]MBG6135196.1 hypothetical protein [Longispora fulva]